MNRSQVNQGLGREPLVAVSYWDWLGGYNGPLNLSPMQGGVPMTSEGLLRHYAERVAAGGLPMSVTLPSGTGIVQAAAAQAVPGAGAGAEVADETPPTALVNFEQFADMSPVVTIGLAVVGLLVLRKLIGG